MIRHLWGRARRYRNVDDPVVRQTCCRSTSTRHQRGCHSEDRHCVTSAALRARPSSRPTSSTSWCRTTSRTAFSPAPTRPNGWQPSSPLTLDDLKQQVETSQGEMLELQKKLGVLGFDPKDNQITSTLDELNNAAGAAELARITAETRYQVLSSMDPSILDQAGNAYAPEQRIVSAQSTEFCAHTPGRSRNARKDPIIPTSRQSRIRLRS